MAQWDQLRKDARNIEGSLEAKIKDYAHINSLFHQRDPGESKLEEIDNLEQEISELLDKLSAINESIRVCILPRTVSSQTQSAVLQRYREILQDYTNEFKKLKASISHKRDRTDLFVDVRSLTERSGGLSPETEQLLRERHSILESGRMTDEQLKQALDIRSDLRTQRSSLSSSGSKLGTIISKLPIVQVLIGAIQKKRTRDNMIVAAFTGFCICVLLLYWLNK